MKIQFILLIFLIYSNTAFADSGISAAFVKDSEIFISIENAEKMQLTHDGIPKNLPVWSKDGSMIAFIEKPSKTVALARLVVIGRSGKPLYNFLIHPVDPDVKEGGMRFVERVQWVTNTKISVDGSINPSTGEVILFDLSTRKISENFLCNGFPAYSPDGLHVAYISPVPHFTPRNEEEPQLYVDKDLVFPAVGVKTEFITDLAWSADSQALAAAVKDLDTGLFNIIIWHPGDYAQPLLIPLPIKQEGDRYIVGKIYWNGDTLTVVADQKAWSFEKGRLSEISLSEAMDPKQDAWKSKMKMETSLGIWAGQSDFWCESCPLSLLPRKSPLLN